MLWRATAILIALALSPPAFARQAEPGEPHAEKIGENRYRIGKIEVDTARREATIPGVVNNVTVLEFVACTKGGFKAYESALELDTDAISFNLAMVLLGLDSSRSKPSRFHFDPNPPEGDPVEIWVEWSMMGEVHRTRAEELIYHETEKRTFPVGPWVYTGSQFTEDGRYLADADGVLIGFVHTPAPVIDNPRSEGVGNFGSWILNPEYRLKMHGGVKLIVRALEHADSP